MNLATIIILALIAGAMFLAVRHVAKKGPCELCEDAKSCGKKADMDAQHSGCPSCSLNQHCSSKALS